MQEDVVFIGFNYVDYNYYNPDIFKVKVTATVGGTECPDELQTKVVYPKIDIIDFKSTKSVTHEGDWVTHDPEWRSTMTDESVSVFTRKTKIKVDATFKTTLALTDPTEISRLYANVAWWVTGDCDLESEPTAQSVSGDSTVITMEGTSVLMDEIYAYEQSWLWTRGLKYEWFYEMTDTGSEDHDIKPDPDDNQHDLYVTLSDPAGATTYETLLHISCNAARGENTVTETQQETWDEFIDCEVKRKDGAQMSYYADYNVGHYQTRELIEHTDGQCGSWAKLYLDILRHHGIDNANDYVHFTPKKPDDDGFLVNEWDFSGAGTSGDADYPYINILDLSGAWPTAAAYPWLGTPEVSDQNGIPGQKTANPASIFGNHQITLVQSEYRDPSYGEVFTGLDDVDNRAIAGFYKTETRIGDEDVMGMDLNNDGDMTDIAVSYLVMLIRKNQAGEDLERTMGWTNYP
ncbi:hypothetical protein ACFLQR_00070 [Verrucomicrobiota bacterium]